MSNVEAWKGLKQTWEMVSEEIDLRIKDLEARLRTCTADQLISIQTKISVFESLKRFPDDVIEREGE